MPISMFRKCITLQLLCFLSAIICYRIADAQCIDYSDYLHWRASVDTPGQESSVAISGDHAYVAAGEAGLQVVDITGPDAPLIVGHVDTPGTASDVAISGTFAYVADSFSGLQVVNIQNPELPTIVGYVDTPGQAVAVTLAGSYAHVADKYKGLQVIDISVPSAPTIVGSLETLGIVDIAVSGAYAYAAPWMNVIDISNPGSPVVVGAVNKSDWGVEGIAIHDGYVYAAAYELLPNNRTKSSLDVIDIGSPTSPVIVGSVEIFGRAMDVAVSGAVAFVADGIGLTTVEITNPTSPTFLGQVRRWSSAMLGAKIAVSGPTAYVAATIEGSHLFDVANPASPPVLARIDTRYAQGVALSMPYAFVADYDAGIHVIDVTDPVAPAIVTTLNTSGRVMDIAISGSYAYVADDSAGLRVLDITNPISPQIVGSVLTDAPVYDLALSGSYVYVTDASHELQVIDVSDPESPLWVTTMETPGMSFDVLVSGSYAYVAGDLGLQVVDISNPASPEIVGDLNTPGGALAVSNSLVYMTHYSFGLRVIDVSNPTSPALVGSLMIPGTGSAVTVMGSFAYVDGFGLEVVDISNPSSPSPKGSVPWYGGAVAISEPYAFVAAGSSFVTVRSQCEIPTPVLLSYFEADPQPGAVLLEWATSFERDFSGFHVLRSAHRENEFERITSELIQAPYRFLDTRVNAGAIYYYTLEAVDRSGHTERMGLVSATPSSSVERLRPRLEEASPNPSTASATRIAFTLTESGPVALTLLDVSGRRVRVLLDERLERGERSVSWDGRDDQGTAVPAGVYLIDLKGPGLNATRRLVWLR